jgi:hypothetical protein
MINNKQVINSEDLFFPRKEIEMKMKRYSVLMVIMYILTMHKNGSVTVSSWFAYLLL